MYLITGLSTGGAEMLIRDIVERVDSDRFEIVVVSILPLGQIGKQIRDFGIKTLSLGALNKFNPQSLWLLLKILREEKPDILHTHLFHADILGRVLGSITGVPKIISTIHNVEFGSLFREKLLSLTRSFVDLNIAVSKRVASNAVKKGIVDKDKVQVIHNGINLKNFPEKDKAEMRNKLDIPKYKKVFVSVGSLTKQKGYTYLIQAVASVDKEALFIILGEGPEREKLKGQIQDYGLQDKIILKGNVDNVNEFLQAANFFIMPSLWEGFSVALLEAAWAGKVIIATDVGGNTEIINDSETGFLVDSEDAKRLAGKIDYVFTLTSDKIDSIGRRAKERVGDEFSIQKMVDNHEELYE
jgi:glycosyltransferase involved in cell wall biosynthesis